MLKGIEFLWEDHSAVSEDFLKTRTSTDFKPKPSEPAVDFLLKIVQEKYLEKYSCPFSQRGNGKEICPFWLTGNVKYCFPKIKDILTCLL